MNVIKNVFNFAIQDMRFKALVKEIANPRSLSLTFLTILILTNFAELTQP